MNKAKDREANKSERTNEGQEDGLFQSDTLQMHGRPTLSDTLVFFVDYGEISGMSFGSSKKWGRGGGKGGGDMPALQIRTSM